MTCHFISQKPMAEGDMRCVKLDGKRVLLVRAEGRYWAVDERCPHEDAQLSKGALHGCRVSCPLHGSEFDIRTGQPLNPPADESLSTYSVREAESGVYIEIP